MNGHISVSSVAANTDANGSIALAKDVDSVSSGLDPIVNYQSYDMFTRRVPTVADVFTTVCAIAQAPCGPLRWVTSIATSMAR